MNTKYIISVVVAVLIIGSVVLYSTSSTPVATAPQNVPANQAQMPGTISTVSAPVSATTSVKKTIVAPRSSNASITGVVLTSAITKMATSVQAGKAATTFTPTTKDIYAVLSLKNATTRTQLSYIRKFNGEYVDSKVSHPLKTGDKQFYFGWSLKTGQTRNVGSYGITFYVDGKKAQTVTYTVH